MFSSSTYLNDSTGSVPYERVLRLIVHIKGKKIKVLVSGNATVQDCKKEVHRVYKSITGIETNVSHLCDADQCILCDDYPAGLILSDKMEVFGVTEEDSSKSNISKESFNDALGSVTSSFSPNNHGTPLQKTFPVNNFCTPVNPMYFQGGFAVPGTYFMSCPERRLQTNMDKNASGRSTIMDSSLRPHNGMATPSSSRNANYSGTDALTPLPFSWMSSNSSAHHDHHATADDSDMPQPTLANTETTSEKSASSTSANQSVSSGPEASSQHYPVQSKKELNSVPDIAIRSNSNMRNTHKDADIVVSLRNSLSKTERTPIEDTVSSTDEDSDSTVIEASPKKHQNLVNMEESMQNASNEGLLKKSKLKRKADSNLEHSPKKLKCSNHKNDSSPRTTRARHQRLAKSNEGKNLKDNKQKGQQHRTHQEIQNQVKSSAERDSVKTMEKLHTSDLPVSTAQQKRAILQTKRLASKNIVTDSKQQNGVLQMEKFSKKSMLGKVDHNIIPVGRPNKDNLHDSQQLFESDREDDSSEDGSVYMSPRQSTSITEDRVVEDLSDNLSGGEDSTSETNEVGKTRSKSTTAKISLESTQQDSSSTSESSEGENEDDDNKSDMMNRTIPSLGSLVNKSRVEVKTRPQVRRRNLHHRAGSKTFSSSCNFKNQ